MGVTSSSTAACGGGHKARPAPQRLAVPAYWTPRTAAGAAMFDRLVRSAPATAIVVVNGSRSAPEAPHDPAWARTFGALTAAGIRALGYVDTGYLGIDLGPGSHGTRPDGAGAGGHTVDAWLAQARRDIDDWYALYRSSGVAGIFLDQTASARGPADAYLAAYRTLAGYARTVHPGGYLVMNPGMAPDPGYHDLADTLVTFEGGYQQYLDRPAVDWERHVAPQALWHLVYGVPDQAALSRVVALSKQRGAGLVYITTDGTGTSTTGHPWDALPAPPYWRSEVDTVFGPVPGTT